jgi:DNA-binding response OmpR family regulator
MALDDKDERKESRKQDEAVGPGAAGSERKPRVLIIDDEPSIRFALRRFFARMGWDVSEAADGRAALSLIMSASSDAGGSAAAGYDMVLSDVRMPGLSGIQLYERIKAERPDIIARLVFSTGDTSGTEIAEFLSRIGCPVVPKPFRLSDLQDIAERLLRTQS